MGCVCRLRFGRIEFIHGRSGRNKSQNVATDQLHIVGAETIFDKVSIKTPRHSSHCPFADALLAQPFEAIRPRCIHHHQHRLNDRLNDYRPGIGRGHALDHRWSTRTPSTWGVGTLDGNRHSFLLISRKSGCFKTFGHRACVSRKQYKSRLSFLSDKNRLL